MRKTYNVIYLATVEMWTAAESEEEAIKTVKKEIRDLPYGQPHIHSCKLVEVITGGKVNDE